MIHVTRLVGQLMLVIGNLLVGQGFPLTRWELGEMKLGVAAGQIVVRTSYTTCCPFEMVSNPKECVR
jgi:hypothetical protein